MAKVYVYDNYTNKFYTYTLNESDPMPYSSGTTLMELVCTEYARHPRVLRIATGANRGVTELVLREF